MKAMVYYGEHDIRFEERQKPQLLNSGDVIIRMVKTTICGTDLGILKGKNPEIQEIALNKFGSFNGRILGHEGVGVIEEIGSSVTKFKKGDKVIISCICRCGSCENCQKQLYSHCQNEGGWIMGYMIDGTQAEYVRVPYADNSLYLLPENLNEDTGVLLSDALPTGHEIGVLNGEIKPGDTVAIVGAGPVGMSCLLTSQLYSPSNIIMIDIDDNRLTMAKEMGAHYTINPEKEDAINNIMALTQQRGVDCAIEAVGIEPTWNICQSIIKEGGNLANVGVHGKPVKFSIEKLWSKNMTITTGLVNTNTIGLLMSNCCSGRLQTEKLVTHHFKFNAIEKAYDVFKHAANEKAIKVIIEF
ncbi:zinc-dependent alcohol dehydrogenase family protein [Salmonella enterica]|nr:zinc-dependent alcohol dehydrogenase family protein [Salmonella enterica]EFS4585797.1 zinc-dependent alcohol dehydrogenase family protein [Salmonella enterica]